VTVELSRDALERMSQEDLVLLAKKLKEHEQTTKYAKGDIYLKRAHAKQIEFHKAPNRVRVFFGGNRSGKTTAGTNEMRWLLEGTHPHRPFRVPIKACIVVQDFQTHAKDIINPKIEEWFPPNLIVATDTNQAKAIVHYKMRNGSTLDVKSHEQDLKVFEGSDYDVVWFDEPPPEAIFKALWRGLTDRRGIAYFTGTPLTEPWLYDLHQKAVAEDNKGMYWTIFSSIHENVINIGEGNVEEGKVRIKEFLEALDPDEREAREKGHFLHMRGLIFKSWRRSHHLISAFKWPTKWPVLISLDPHPRKPWALSFLGLSPAGYRFLIASYKIDGVVEDVAEQLLTAKNEIPLDGPGQPRIHSCWIDNYASVESMIKRSTTIIEELNRLVTPTVPRFRPAPKNVEEKINIFKSWLKVNDTKYGPRPGFMVFDVPENREFIREIEHYVWASQRGARRALLKNTPEKENDDILDTVMQLALVLDSKKRQDAKEEPPKVFNYAGR
jgi:phage terminase large subunit-like protein